MIKYLRFASDLHLEGFQGRNPDTLLIDFVPAVETDAETMLILAGDISSDPNQLAFFLRAACEKFAKVLFVPGNHEYYKHHYQAWNETMRERLAAFEPKLMFALGDVQVAEVDGVRYIFGTLWGDGGPSLADQGQVGFYLNDFRLITYTDHEYKDRVRKMRVPDMVYEHKKQKAAVDAALRIPFDGNSIVVTHHLPSRRLVSARFWPSNGSDGANGGFVGQCDDILAYDHAPKIWVHGHTHDTVDTKLWETRIICNPAGYRGEYATSYNTFMTAELREDGTRRAVVQPKIIELDQL